MNRYIIIGAGAIGAGLAAQFELNGIPYLLCGRGEQIRHIAAHGIDYVRPSGVQKLRLQTCGAIEEMALNQHDRLVFATKTQDLEAACRDWAWRPVRGDGPVRCASELPVLTPQNGLAAERIALRWFERVHGASISTPARYTRLGEIVVGGYPEPGLIVVGRFPASADPVADEIAADLARAGYLAEAQPDIMRWKAAKLLNSVRNNAIELFDGSTERLQAFSQGMVREALAVLAAMGVEPARQQERRHSVAHWGIAPGCGIEPGQQSTWQSLARGSSLEVDFLNGEVVLLGRLHGVPTPFNAAIQQTIGRLAQPGRKAQDRPLGHVDLLWRSVQDFTARQD